MAYLDNTDVSIDAILTTKGRELLAKGTGFQITQFALSDDEVDYGLYTTSHPLGTNFYGSIIENMPLVEASPDETQVMKYKLVTLPRGTKQIPIISLGFTSISLTYGQSNPLPIRPSTTQTSAGQTLNGPGFGYTAILYDSDAAVLVGTGLATNNSATTPAFFGDVGTANAVVARGLEFTLTPKDVSAAVTTQLTIVGNETGASITIPVVVNPEPTI